MKGFINPFKEGQRVKVNIPQIDGIKGTVIKARKHNKVVWVEMDDNIPDDLRTFHPLDSRANQIVAPIDDVMLLEDQSPRPHR